MPDKKEEDWETCSQCKALKHQLLLGVQVGYFGRTQWKHNFFDKSCLWPRFNTTVWYNYTCITIYGKCL